MQDKQKQYVTKEELHSILNRLNVQLAKIELQIMLIKKELKKNV